MSGTAEVARALVSGGKGLLAADESPGTMGRRFESSFGGAVPNTIGNRMAYRACILGADLGAYISGVILHEETLMFDEGGEGDLVALLARKGIAAGIKVDQGTCPLASASAGMGETQTNGLEGLGERLARYRARGAVFAKWRATYMIDPAQGLPSGEAVRVNAEQLARYAQCCLEAGIVPIVEPEVLSGGSHTAEQCAEASGKVLRATFAAMADLGVDPAQTLLKPAMVTAGSGAGGGEAAPEGVARATVSLLASVVPPSLPGVVFLSGGQSEEQATAHLQAMNAQLSSAEGAQAAGWPQGCKLSFSYGRALQKSVLAAWGGSEGGVAAARRKAEQLARCNWQAAQGKYVGPHPSRGDCPS